MTIYRYQTENQSAFINTTDVKLLFKMANANEMFDLLNKTIDLLNDPDASSFDADKLSNEIFHVLKTIQNSINENI